MPEGVVVVAGHEHAREDGLTDGGVEVFGRTAVHGGEQVVRHAHAAGREQTEHGLRARFEAFVAGQQQVAQGVGQLVVGRAAVEAEELLDEEGHALAAVGGAGEEFADRGRRRGSPSPDDAPAPW